MTKGIRSYTNARFAKLLPQFVAGELTGKEFRAKVIDNVVAKFEINVASASTHYNHSLKMQRAADPASVANLGRPEDKNNGGRKPIHVVDVIKVKTGEVVATGVSKGAAEKLIAKAAASRKAKLAVRVEETA